VSESKSKQTRLDICRKFVASVRHSKELSLEVRSATEDTVHVYMPYRECLVGNPDNKIIHGGAIFAMMDQAGGLAGACAIYPDFEITPTIDMRVDHLRAPAVGEGLICKAECYRLSQSVVFVRMDVYAENDTDTLISTGMATYMRMKIPTANRIVK